MRIIITAGTAFGALLIFAVYFFPHHNAPGPIENRDIPEISVVNDPLRITVFGTSLSRGYTWPDKLAHQLGGCFQNPVHISRVVQSGAGSAWGLSHIDDVVQSAPDILIMEFSINDADILDGVSLGKSFIQHDRLITELKEKMPRTGILLMTTSPAFGLRGLLRPRLKKHYEIYKILANEHDVGLADIYGNWDGEINRREQFPDGLHPLDDLATQKIVPILSNMVSDAFRNTC